MPPDDRTTDDDRQRLNVRAIRVTLASARQHASPPQVALCVARARQLLQHARDRATSASVISDIDALEAELPAIEAAAPHGQER